MTDRCTATTKAGMQCLAFAVRDSDPPYCSAHLGRNVGAGAPKRNQNRRTHGFYGRYYSPEEIDDLKLGEVDESLDGEILVVRVALRRALRVLEEEEADSALVAALVPLVFSGGRTVARLLRDRMLLSSEDPNAVMKELADALEALGDEWGTDL